MIIRAFEEDDTESVVSVWEACGLTRSWNDPRKDIARKLQVQPELFLVGEEAADQGGSGIIATVMAGTTDTEDGSTTSPSSPPAGGPESGAEWSPTPKVC